MLFRVGPATANYFCSRRSGRAEVWKLPAKGGTASQVTAQGGTVAEESPDGRTLYYLKDLAGLVGPLWRRAIGGGEEHKVVDSVVLRNFAVGERTIYYARPDQPSGYSIRSFDLATGIDTRIGEYTKRPSVGLRLSPDRRRLIYTQIDQEGSDLMLAENFR
jgi:Tol biopolymer transport system component